MLIKQLTKPRFKVGTLYRPWRGNRSARKVLFQMLAIGIANAMISPFCGLLRRIRPLGRKINFSCIS